MGIVYGRDEMDGSPAPFTQESTRMRNLERAFQRVPREYASFRKAEMEHGPRTVKSVASAN